jgi:pimeloyl-ACP methyl ester carboxylesterase
MPDIRFAPSDDVSIAYDTVGDGPIDIVYVQGYVSHLEVMWELPAYRSFCERIGKFARLIRFDKRGMGMSDRVPSATNWETRMDDIRAVMDAVGSEQAAIMGESEGGPLAMLFAAAHPERTRALVLQGAEVRERTDDEWPWGEATPEEFEANMKALPEQFGKGRGFARLAPSVGDVEWGREWFGKLQRNAGTPGSVEGFIRVAYEIDVRGVPQAISVPTLIYHAVDDQICRIGNARYLADAMPHARLVERPGADHLPWFEEADTFMAELEEFLTGARAPAHVDRVLATLLFTDIVGSTTRAADEGDRRWQELLAEHQRIVRRTVEGHAGHTVDMVGDGMLATFDGPARAIRCAQAIGRQSAPLELEIRAGVHTGEVERTGEGVAGIAVHEGARVAAKAGPGQIWVSEIVRLLTPGSGLEYADEGQHELKGIPGQRQLYSVA